MFGKDSGWQPIGLREKQQSFVRRLERARTLALLTAHQTVERARGGPRPRPASDIQVVIHNRDRLAHLRAQVAWLEAVGFERILILDNASTYAPLLDWYEETPHEVVYADEDLGSHALWKHPVFERVRRDYYVYTDPGVVGCDDCPRDFTEFFFETLARFPWCEKVGFALRIDDLPEHFEDAARVKERESVHWAKPYSQHLYDAEIDTTFALYRPFAEGGSWCRALRAGGPYQARHLAWYENSSRPSDEELYSRARR